MAREGPAPSLEVVELAASRVRCRFDVSLDPPGGRTHAKPGRRRQRIKRPPSAEREVHAIVMACARPEANAREDANKKANRALTLETASRRPKAYLRHPNSARASAISGISRVGKKPSSAEARMASASFRRPVVSQSLASEYEAMSA